MTFQRHAAFDDDLVGSIDAIFEDLEARWTETAASEPEPTPAESERKNLAALILRQVSVWVVVSPLAV